MEPTITPGTGDSATFTPYEVAVQREMLNQARRCVRLECAVQSAIHALVTIALPAIEGDWAEWRRIEILARVETLKRALAEKEI